MKERKPLLASGKIIENYSLLFEYCRIHEKEKGVRAEDILLNRRDFDYIRKLVQEGVRNVGELLSRLAYYYKSKIDSNIAVKAYANTYNIDVNEVSKDIAVNELARILAGWLIEASENLGILEIKGYFYK